MIHQTNKPLQIEQYEPHKKQGELMFFGREVFPASVVALAVLLVLNIMQVMEEEMTGLWLRQTLTFRNG